MNPEAAYADSYFDQDSSFTLFSPNNDTNFSTIHLPSENAKQVTFKLEEKPLLLRNQEKNSNQRGKLEQLKSRAIQIILSEKEN